MKAVVVYDSLWGNTAAVARAIAEGIGEGARALSTSEATSDVIKDAELVVAGSPVLGFRLPSEKVRSGARTNPGGKPPRPAEVSQPSLRSWLDALPPGHGLSAAFDTQVRGPFGKAAPTIAAALEKAGYERAAEPAGFLVAGKFGPLRKGELERAREWGAELGALARVSVYGAHA